jgi:tripartite-type tricarboxylate transporter receptor subunit TctC
MGTAGSVLPVHLFNMLAKTRFHIVPYKGAGPMSTDLMGGHVPLAIAAVSSLLPAVRAGRARVLGVTSPSSSPGFADAPTIAAELPGFQASSWFGFFAPRGIPKELVTRIWSDVSAVLHMPETRQRLIDAGGEPVGQSPDEFAARVRSDIALWQKVAAEVDFKPQ